MEIIGVDLGGTKILARRVDPKTGKASKWAKMSTPRQGPESVLDGIVKLVRKLDPDAKRPAIGVGVPGPVLESGVATRCSNIEGWDSPVDVRSYLEAELGQPVAVGNDVNCGALAEYEVGAGRGSESLLAVFVGTGVGGGLVLGGDLLVGPRGMAGEIGHVTVTPGGRECGCGQLGHLEAYAGKSGMQAETLRLARSGVPSRLGELMGDGRLKSSQVAAALESGCEVTHHLIQDAADAMARAISNLQIVVDLDRVVLGGGMVDRLGQPFIEQISTSPSFGRFGPDLAEFRIAERIDDAGAVGAAILAHQVLRARRKVSK